MGKRSSKRKVNLLVFCFAMTIIFFILVAAGSSFAGILEYKTDEKHSIDIKFEGYYLHFNSSDLTKVNGWMDGIGLSYTYHSPKNFMVKPELWLTHGSLEYKGPLEHSNNSSPGTLNDVDSYLFEIRTLFGYDVKISETSPLILYTGLGFRMLYMDVDGKITYTTSARTIQIGTIDYSNIYIPFGIKFGKSFYGEEHRGWSFTATIEDDISRWASRGNGLRGSIEWQKRFKYISIAVEPFIRYWRFEEDNTPVHDANGNEVGKTHEPVNHTTEIGINWKVRF